MPKNWGFRAKKRFFPPQNLNSTFHTDPRLFDKYNLQFIALRLIFIELPKSHRRHTVVHGYIFGVLVTPFLSRSFVTLTMLVDQL